MTAPPSTQSSPPNQPGGGPAAGITFDEIERQLKDAEKTALSPKMDEFKVEGDDIPDNLKGKSARDLLNHIKTMEDTLRNVDAARQQALTMAQLAAQGRSEPAPAPVAPEPEPLITSEQVAAAFSEDATKGVELMNKMMQGFNDGDLQKLGDLIAKLPPPQPAGGPADPGRIEQGRALAEQNRCNFCHQESYSGERNVPRLAGQREDYLVDSMIAFRDNRRVGGDTVMSAVLYGVSDADIRAMAHFLARER